MPTERGSDRGAAPPTPDAPSEGWSAHVIFVCADDDDLELVSLVHRARDAQIAVEVLAGVDRDPEHVLEGLEGQQHEACVLFCGEGFSPSDALAFRKKFEARFPTEELLIMQLDPSRAESQLEVLSRRLALGSPRDLRTSARPPEPESALPAHAIEPIEPIENQGSRTRLLVLVSMAGFAVAAALGAFLWSVTIGATSEETPVGKTAAAPSEATPPAPAPPPAQPPMNSNLALVHELVGGELAALEALPQQQIDAAALLIRAKDSKSPCAAKRAGELALSAENPELLRRLSDAGLELPSDCAAEQATPAPEPSGPGAEIAESSAKPRRKTTRSPPRRPAAPVDEPSTPAPQPKKKSARLIDDGLLQTSD